MGDVNLNALWSRALVEELARSGVGQAVICPGSRSAPLALALAELPHFVGVDERSAAFFALGLAKRSGCPVALLATSGTAGANFHPAVAEASASGVPLLVLTADRPWELQGFGAPQTMEQRGLFGPHVRHELGLACPEASDAALLHLRAAVDRAVALARHGPVHLNVPFREPLAPTPDGTSADALSALARYGRGGAPLSRFLAPAGFSEEAAQALADRLARCERGLIVCGPRSQDDGFAEAALALGARAGVPVVTEACSQARFCPAPGGAVRISHHDAFLRSARLRSELTPDFVLRLGGTLTTRALTGWVDAAEDCAAVMEGAPVDPHHRASLLVEAPATALLRAVAARLPARGTGSPWCERLAALERSAAGALEVALGTGAGLSEALAARAVVAGAPEGASLLLSSSMPIRSVEAFGGTSARSLRVLANRGVNGIDGVVSTALGVAACSSRPALALVGDLAFLHDLNALALGARHRLSLTVVLLNNGGGGIFSHLAIRQLTPRFEALFATAHGLSFAPVAELFGARYERPSHGPALSSALARAAEGGLHLIEVVTERAAEASLHRQLLDEAAAAAERGAP